MSCGITEEELNEQIKLKEQIKNLNLKRCKRCDNDKPIIVLQKRDVFCKICFNDYILHKFRGTIAKSKVIKTNNKVLIAFSGGQNSVAMINLTIDSMNRDSSSKLIIKPSILYIDETSVLNDELKSNEYNNKINELLNNFKMDKYYSKLEFYFNKSDYYSKDKQLNDNQQLKDELHKILNSFKSLTAKEDYLKKIRINLIKRIARAEEMDCVFLGTNGTRLSIQLLTDVAQGKGNQIDSDICFNDERDSNVKLLKPMREFISKEIIFWNDLMNNKYVIIEDLMAKKSTKSTISKITEQFINSLQKDYPSTTYTITKIGYKLKNQNELKKKCLFCQSPVDEIDDNKLSAQTALVITDSFASNKKESFNTNYCYSCNILLRETNLSNSII